MKRFIGIDVHVSTCSLCVRAGDGKILREDVLETNGKTLRAYTKLIPGTKYLCVEEGTQSQWLYEILSPLVCDMVVVEGKSKDPKNDRLDARCLAERIRVRDFGAPIFKAPAHYTSLRDLARSYQIITKEVTRLKNQILAMFRSRGKNYMGMRGIFTDEAKQELLIKDLPRGTQQGTRMLYRALKEMLIIKKEAQKAMTEEAFRFPEAKLLCTIPGLGPIRSSQLIALVVTPHRFRTKRQFWEYCGLGIVTRSSADYSVSINGRIVKSKAPLVKGLNRNFNRVGKSIFKDAAHTVINKKSDGPICQHYHAMLQKGILPHRAKLTIARQIASIALAIWKNKETYAPKNLSVASASSVTTE
jgi:hypothetical protein